MQSSATAGAPGQGGDSSRQPGGVSPPRHPPAKKWAELRGLDSAAPALFDDPAEQEALTQAVKMCAKASGTTTQQRKRTTEAAMAEVRLPSRRSTVICYVSAPAVSAPAPGMWQKSSPQSQPRA